MTDTSRLTRLSPSLCGAPLGRHVLTVDVWLGGEPRGELAEMLPEVLPA
jgi:hypothetical protein